MLLVAGSAACAFAEHPRADHPSASAVDETMVAADKIAEMLLSAEVITAQEVSLVNPSIVALIKNGVTADETENVVKQAVIEAKAQGLKDEELAAKVEEAVQEYFAPKEPEHPASEHPAEKPKDHPGR